MYPDESLKAQTQARSRTGPRTQLGPEGSSPIPKRDWQKFLANIQNNKELFSFIAEQLSQVDINCLLVLSTTIENVVSNQHCDIASLHHCNHTETNTQIMFHLRHGAQQGHAHIFVRTMDGDVVMLAVSIFQELLELGVEQLLVELGSSKHYLPIHHVCLKLGPQKSISLSLFHALTGCDTTSQILGCGKKTAWAVWDVMPGLSATFLSILDDPILFMLESVHLKQIERFVVLMHSNMYSYHEYFPLPYHYHNSTYTGPTFEYNI